MADLLDHAPKLDCPLMIHFGETDPYADAGVRESVHKAIGGKPGAEIHVYETQTDDSYVLCSDGLSDMVEDEEIRVTLVTLRSNPNLTVQQLIQTANDNGGRDNISAMLIRVAEPFGVPRGWVARLKALFR